MGFVATMLPPLIFGTDMADIPNITPYVTSTITTATSAAVAAQTAALNGAVASGTAAINGAVGSASAALATAIPAMPSLSGINASVEGLTSRLGNPAALLAGIPSPATAVASALSAFGLGGNTLTAGASIANLAKTTFSSGANDKLATLDVYTAKSALVPIDITAPEKPINPLTMLSTVNSYLGAVNNLVKDYSKLAAKSLDPMSIVNGLLSSNPTIQSAFNSLPIELKNAVVVAQAFTADSGSRANRIPSNAISINNNGVKSTVTNSSLQEVNAMVAMAAALSNGAYKPTITDDTSIPIVLGNVIKIAAAMQLPGAFGAIMGSLAPTPANVRIKGSLATIATNNAISNGSLSLLTEVAKNSTALVNTRHVLGGFSKNYALAPNETSKDYALIGARMRASYSSIYPKWNRAAGQSGDVNALDAFLNVSVAMKGIIDVFSQTASIPPVVKPRSVIVVPASQVSTYVVPTPVGVIATSTTNTDGSVTHTLAYPAQGAPAPIPDATSLAFVGPTIPGLFSFPTTKVTAMSLVEDATTQAKSVIQQSLITGSTQLYSKLSNGTQELSKTETNGVVTTTIVDASVSDSDVITALSVSGDPLAGTAYLAVSDPMLGASAVQQYCDMDIQYAEETNSPALSSMNAADAINYSFPHSNMNNLETLEA